jgi:hypothetical protein
VRDAFADHLITPQNAAFVLIDNINMGRHEMTITNCPAQTRDRGIRTLRATGAPR